MASDRALRLLLLLQARRRLTAEQAAEALEVSVRTVYRDLDALSAMGVPVTAERGPGGGVGLRPGWRTEVSGLTDDEVTALAATSPPAAFAALGLGQAHESASWKLLASLPAFQRPAAHHAAERLLVDGSGWLAASDDTTHLETLREALWQDRCLSLTVVDGHGRRSTRTVRPLGVVLQGDRWYLVAGTEHFVSDSADVRTFRGARIEAATMTSQTFARPASFSLRAYWRSTKAAFRVERARYPVTLSLTAEGAAALAALRPERERAGIMAGGNANVVVDFEREAIAFGQVLELDGVTVLAPPALVARLARTGARLSARYGANGAHGATADDVHAQDNSAGSI